MSLYIPRRNEPFSPLRARDYLSNLLVEFREIPFDSDEKRVLHTAAMYGRLLDERTRPFFYYHMAPLISKAVASAFSTSSAPNVLDLGCGSGTLSVLFSLLGARVIGIDMDPNIIEACRKKKSYYEEICGKLDVRFEVADAFAFDYQSVAPIDFLYSLFAFNLMQPSVELLSLVSPQIKKGGRIFISDGNKDSIYNKLFRRRSALGPLELRYALTEMNYHVLSLEYDCMLPPVIVRHKRLFEMGKKIETAVDKLDIFRWFGVSYTIEAEKR